MRGPPEVQRPGGGGPGAAASQENVQHQNSRPLRARNLRRMLGAHLDVRVSILLGALAPNAEAQAAVRRIRRGVEPELDEIVEDAGR